MAKTLFSFSTREGQLQETKMMRITDTRLTSVLSNDVFELPSATHRARMPSAPKCGNILLLRNPLAPLLFYCETKRKDEGVLLEGR